MIHYIYLAPFFRRSTRLLVSLILLLDGLIVLLVVVLEAAGGHAVQAEDGLVGVLDEDVLALLAVEDHVGDCSHDTPTVGEGQVHLVGEVARLPANDAQNDVLIVRAGVHTGDETRKAKLVNLGTRKRLSVDVYAPKLHDVGLGQNALHRPAGQLAAVVLHLGGHDGTTLGDQLAAPVQSTAASLGLAVELVEGLDGHELIITADGVLLNGIDLGTHDEVDGLLVVGRKIESSVLVGLAGGGIGVLRGVVEGVGVGHGDLGRLALVNNLVGEVVVDVGGLLGKCSGLVDSVLATVSGIERSISGIFVDGDHVEGGVVTLVKEDLVALADDDNVPGVDRAGRAHEHGENAVRGEDGGLVLLGVLLDDGVRRGGDVVGSTVNGLELLLGTLDRRLVVGAVVVVQEAVVVEVLTLVSVQVQLGQTVEVNLLDQVPVSLDVDAGIAVASRLVIVLPAEATAATSSVAAATVVATVALAGTGAGTLQRASTTTTGIAPSTTLATATGEDGTTAVSRLGGISGVADDGEG